MIEPRSVLRSPLDTRSNTDLSSLLKANPSVATFFLSGMPFSAICSRLRPESRKNFPASSAVPRPSEILIKAPRARASFASFASMCLTATCF